MIITYVLCNITREYLSACAGIADK